MYCRTDFYINRWDAPCKALLCVFMSGLTGTPLECKFVTHNTAQILHPYLDHLRLVLGRSLPKDGCSHPNLITSQGNSAFEILTHAHTQL